MFLDDAGQPLPYADAVTSGRATGVPGAMAMLGLAHERYGRLPWSQLFAGVARLADDGFVVPKRLARFANSQFRQATLPDARALFGRPDGSTVQAGDTLRNPAYAATLRALAERGARALLEAPIADEIIARTHAEPRPGTLAPEDFAAFNILDNCDNLFYFGVQSQSNGFCTRHDSSRGSFLLGSGKQ